MHRRTAASTVHCMAWGPPVKPPAAMAPSLLDTFRTLASFSPPRTSLRGAPWEEYVDWAIAQGLAPLAAYNLEYRLGGAGAPEWARDRLMSIYSGSVNDNVMKLVNFKQTVDALEGRKILLLGAGAYADALYPHVGFRPVLDLDLLTGAEDVKPFAGFLGQSDFRPMPKVDEPKGADMVLSDGRTMLFLYSRILGANAAELERGLFERATPLRIYGPSFFRLSLEDAILISCLEHARAGYEVPLVTFLDLRELVLGAPMLGGPYSRPPDFETIKARATSWRIERAVYTSLAILERLYPQTASAVAAARPALTRGTRRLLDGLVVDPVTTLGKVRVLRGGARLRRLLAGPHF